MGLTNKEIGIGAALFTIMADVSIRGSDTLMALDADKLMRVRAALVSNNVQQWLDSGIEFETYLWGIGCKIDEFKKEAGVKELADLIPGLPNTDEPA